MPRHDPSGAGEPPRPARRPLLIGLATLLVLAAAGCGLDNTGDQAAAPSTSASRAVPATPSASPTCLPRVVETGFSYSTFSVHYGVIAENPCPQVAINNIATAVAFDASGKPVGEAGPGPMFVVMFPGQRSGAGGIIQLTKPAKVASVTVTFTDSEAAPISDFVAWARSVTVDGIRHNVLDGYGDATISGYIQTDPPGATLCEPRANLILRDRSGRIVYGDADQVRGTLVSFDVTLPKGVDRSRTEIYINQGRDAITLLPHGPVAACATR